MTSPFKHLDILAPILTIFRTCVKNLVLQNFCACPSAKSAFAKSLFPSGETSLKCHHPVPIRNLQFLLSKLSSSSSSFCYGWMMLISSLSMSRYCEDSDEGYFCQALLRIKAFWALRQAKAANSFYLTRKDCTSILHVFRNTDISLIFCLFSCRALSQWFSFSESPKTPGNFPQLSYFSICLILEARSPYFPQTELPPRTT